MNSELSAAAPTGRARRYLASTVAHGYGLVLFSFWFNPLLVLSTATHDDSEKMLWIALGVCLMVSFISVLCIPRRYYNLLPFERDGRLYRRLGVRQFRYVVGEGEGIQRLVRSIDPNWQAPLSKLSYEDRVKWTRMPECIHIGMIFLSLPLIGLAYYRGFTTLATIYLFSNIPINIYPVLLQRYSRAKLLRICELQSKRSPSQARSVEMV